MTEFTQDWFSSNAEIWLELFDRFIPSPRKILEVGSYEGRSSVWLAGRLDPGGVLYCVDTWAGGLEHAAEDMAAVEKRFDRNMTEAIRDGVLIHKIKERSADALAQLITHGHAGTMDFVYIDGSHLACDVMGDLAMSFALCKDGGIIVCDDYLWNYGQDPRLTPKIAIDSFAQCFAGRVEMIQNAPLAQVYFRKVAA